LIEKDSHLLHLCRYIHSNPVKHGLVGNPADWPYSNFLEWVGLCQGTMFTPDFVQQYFPSPGLYQDFVQDDLRGRKLPREIKRYLDKI
jgi:hypothetical protein